MHNVYLVNTAHLVNTCVNLYLPILIVKRLYLLPWAPVREKAVNIYRPFYTSEVIQFRSRFNPDWTGFVASTLKLVPVESTSNRFESIHFAMWFQSRSNWIHNYWGWIHVTQLRVTLVRNSWSGVEERQKLYFAYSLGLRLATTCYQRIQAE